MTSKCGKNKKVAPEMEKWNLFVLYNKEVYFIPIKADGDAILVTRALDRPKALGNSMQENMRRRVLGLLEPYGACSLLVLA